MSSNLAKVMANSLKATEFEWLENDPVANDNDKDNFQFLKDGYLHMTEDEVDHNPSGTRQKDMKHASLVKRASDPSIKGSWRYRWCVLSQTADGVHLLYYKHKASFINCEAPCGVVLLEGCEKLYTIPTHSKSMNTFALGFPHRNVTFYTDTSGELEAWLESFKKALNLQDETTSQSSLKGLPKQKALRKDFQVQPRPSEKELRVINDKKSSPKHKEEVEPLSFRSLSDEPDGIGLQPQAQHFPNLKGLPKKKALHSRQEPGYRGNTREKDLFKDVPVPELESESLPVQFVGFRLLDT